ncbi:hypothetical protein [Paenibacillus lentus]|uniref:Uncharacterized protein n=1 Tax=Paenibacillus lentus TaxID=1338368 RepID=A0A3S8RW86_9BACL|nr:hypothetical protein [Paenibacillus lentus]AZK47094.1 hypothetical protein EIM92_13790 [Paenibacillus lentus]
MIRIFRSTDQLEAIEFADTDAVTIQQIIKFTGKGVTLDYDADGSDRVGIKKDAKSVVLANLGQFIYKTSSNELGVCDYEYLASSC